MPKLEFKGKHTVYAHHLSVPYRALDVVRKKSILGGRGANVEEGNLIIHGDNLHALKALMPRYAGRVNCIYIDPPYNTGNEDWCYNDRVDSPLMQAWLQENGPVDNEDLERHDKWLCMMWPRMHLLRELLADDGIIFVSIDDNEHHHLRIMMDEVFGESSFIADLVVKSNPGGRDYGGIAKTHDYVLVYGSSVDSSLDMIDVDENSLPMRDDLGGFELRELRNRNIRFNSKNRPNLYYPFYVDLKVTDDHGLSPVSVTPKRGWTKVFPQESRGVKTVWRWQKSTVIENIHNVGAKSNRNGGVHIVEKFRRSGKRERSILDSTEYRNEQGTNMLKTLLGSDGSFDYPKSTDLLKRLIKLGADANSIILDSFAGSGTTAHAVLELNQEDGGNRKFILVECEDYADRVTAERVRRVIKGVSKSKDENLQQGLKGSFAFCTLGKELNTESFLRGKDLPDYTTLACHVAYTATGVTIDKIKMGNDRNDYFFGETKNYRLHMIYQPDKEFLRSKKSALTLEMAKRIGKAARKKSKQAIVFAPWKFISQKDLIVERVTFCQLPYAIHQLYGL